VDDQFKVVEIHRLYNPEDFERNFSTCLITEMTAAIGSDGNLYPCNYHPRPGGISYGNAIEVPFRELWEREKRKEAKRQFPHICPAVCDPFKTRANNLLSIIKKVYESEGPDRLEFYKKDLLDSL